VSECVLMCVGVCAGVFASAATDASESTIVYLCDLCNIRYVCVCVCIYCGVMEITTGSTRGSLEAVP
jgi:hypothetical protein